MTADCEKSVLSQCKRKINSSTDVLNKILLPGKI